MVTPKVIHTPQKPLAPLKDEHQFPGPLLSARDWSTLQVVDFFRERFQQYSRSLNDQEQREYVTLQRASIEARVALENGTRDLIAQFEQRVLASLTARLNTLAGREVDPKTAKIHTRYLQEQSSRPRRHASPSPALDSYAPEGKLSSMTLWDAACMNYDGLTGWSYPGRTGLADASYLDINVSAKDFIALIRELDVGGQLKEQLDSALLPEAELGLLFKVQAQAELGFEAVEALRNAATSRVDREKYGALKQALQADTGWPGTYEMTLFVPEGTEGISWTPQSVGQSGMYSGALPGDHLSISHIIFCVSGCQGFFSYFSGRPGGALRHHQRFQDAADNFYWQFQGFFKAGDKEWLFQAMALTDSARLQRLTQKKDDAPPANLSPLAKILYALSTKFTDTRGVERVGYDTSASLEKSPVLALQDTYLKRCQRNLQEFANPTTGFITTLIEVVGTVFNEILELLLIPAPGILRGLERIRRYGMFFALGTGLIQGGAAAIQGRGEEVLQTFGDLADLLVSGRLHTRLARGVHRRHGALYRRLSEQHKVTLPDGSSTLWRPDVRASSIEQPVQLAKVLADDQGLVTHQGQRYARVSVDDEVRLARISQDTGQLSGTLGHAGDGASFRPPVVYDAHSGHWRLDMTGSRSLTDVQQLQRMLGHGPVPARDLSAILRLSNTTHEALRQVWQGAQPSASLLDAVQRFNTDRLIDGVIRQPALSEPTAVASFEVLAPVLTQLADWPADTALRIEDEQGQLLRSYSRDVARSASKTLRITYQDNVRFGYSTPRKTTTYLPVAIVELLASHFLFGLQVSAQPARVTRLRALLADEVKARRFQLFEALHTFAGASRSMGDAAGLAVQRLLPDEVGGERPVSALVSELQRLHPRLSRARVVETLREHPLSAQQQRQLLDVGQQPEALSNAMRSAKRQVRRESMVDAIFYPRRFNAAEQAWAQEFCTALLMERIGRVLLVAPAKAPVPYSSQGLNDRTVVILDHEGGRFSVFYQRTGVRGEVLTGADSFYQAMLLQLSDTEHALLKLHGIDDIAGLRYQVAELMLRYRTDDGRFRLYKDEILPYACEAHRSLAKTGPNALGLYERAGKHWLFLQGQYYQVEQDSGSLHWHIQHPSRPDAYAPLLLHNGSGAWRHEWERPLTWDGLEPFYRLGPVVRSLSADTLQAIQCASGVGEDQLRAMHVRNEPPAPALMESIERFKLHQRINQGLERGPDFLDQALGELGGGASDALVGQTGMTRAEQVAVLEARRQADQPLLEYALLRAYWYKRGVSSDPMVQVIQRHFPGLPVRLAEDLLEHATSAERQSLEAGRVALRQGQEARWLLQDVRLNLAFEGLYLGSAATHDSSRLILHTLATLPGWSEQVRVEVRNATGVIDSIGPLSAPIKRLLRPVDSGRYQACVVDSKGEEQALGRADHFLTALLVALPNAERTALGYTYAGGERELLAEIARRSTADRDQARTFLGMSAVKPWFNPPRRLADGRIGYPLSGEGSVGYLSPVAREQIRRVRDFFPAKSDKEAREMLRDMGDSIREREEILNHLLNELGALKSVLDHWLQQLPQAASDTTGSPVRTGRREAALRILRCWRKEDSSRGVSHELNLDDLDLDELPALAAHFGHVTLLSLKNNRLTALPAYFFRCFPGLRWVVLNGNRLQTLPYGLGRLQYLSKLYLSGNQMRFRLGDVVHLSELTSLDKLDLSGNPLRLGQRLDLSDLRKLKVLNLRNTQIDSLPRGLVTLSRLEVCDLRDNQISVLTSGDLFIYPDVHRAMNLQGNPLSEAALQFLRRYREHPDRSDIHFGLSPQADSLAAQADKWLSVLAVNDVARHQELWTQLQQQQMSDRFFELLQHIASEPAFVAVGYRALREEVTRCVWQLIEGALKNELYALALYQHRYEINSGPDGLLVSLQDLALRCLPHQLLASQSDSAAADVLNYFRAQRRLRVMEDLVKLSDRNLTRGLYCSRVLAYRVALAQTLDLPLTWSTRLDRRLREPAAGLVDHMYRRVIRQEQQFDWPALLVNEEVWVDFLKLQHRRRFETARAGYDQAADVLMERVRTEVINEGEYNKKMIELGPQMVNANSELVAELTQLEWTAFSTSL